MGLARREAEWSGGTWGFGGGERERERGECSTRALGCLQATELSPFRFRQGSSVHADSHRSSAAGFDLDGTRHHMCHAWAGPFSFCCSHKMSGNPQRGEHLEVETEGRSVARANSAARPTACENFLFYISPSNKYFKYHSSSFKRIYIQQEKKINSRNMVTSCNNVSVRKTNTYQQAASNPNYTG